MSKMLTVLKKASEKRSELISSRISENKSLNTIKKERMMRKSWFTWLFIAAAVVMVFVTFNYQGGKDAVPLSEIFPDEETISADVEYEFVQEESEKIEKQQVRAESFVETERPVAVSEPAKEDAVKEIITADTHINFTVQIASFRDKKKAEEALTKIRKNVPSAYVRSRDLGEKGIWFRIYSGQYKLRSEAEVSLHNIKKNYNDSFIISPKKAK